jgi:histidine triad (HIT) family protein
MSACLFCHIVDRTIRSTIVYEDEQALAFQDIHPQAPVHLLVIPKRHVQSVQDLETHDGVLLGHLLRVCVKLAKEKGISESGYRIVTNSGSHAGQTVLHLHFHLLGGRSMTWPPG